jgi:hypothetical protein
MAFEFAAAIKKGDAERIARLLEDDPLSPPA